MVAPEPTAVPRTAPTSGLSNTRRASIICFCGLSPLPGGWSGKKVISRGVVVPGCRHQHYANLGLCLGPVQQLSELREHVQCKGISLLWAIQLYHENAPVHIIENVFHTTRS